jgi:hypothetical protein
VVEAAILEGVADFAVLFCGVSMVNWWLDAGENVAADSHISGVEKHANFARIIFASPEF